jgi:hypothetical protein
MNTVLAQRPKAQISIGIEMASNRKRPDPSQGCICAANNRRQNTILIGKPVQNVGQKTRRPNLIFDMGMSGLV